MGTCSGGAVFLTMLLTLVLVGGGMYFIVRFLFLRDVELDVTVKDIDKDLTSP